MLKHYVKMAFRSLRKQGFYALINVFGLAIGLAVSFLILLFVIQESRFDEFHSRSERVFRVAHDNEVNAREIRSALTPGPLAARLADVAPSIEKTCRLYRETQTVAKHEQVFQEESFLFVDSNFFEFFSVRFLAGDSAIALLDPRAIVLTRNMAVKYFGADDPVGELLLISDQTYVVSGVVEDISRRSHLKFDFIAPLEGLGVGPWIESWSPHIFYTYIRLRSLEQVEETQRAVSKLVSEELGPRFSKRLGKTFPQFLQEGQRFGYFLQPLTGIHLDSNLTFELQEGGDRRLVYSLALVSLLIVLIASVNYVNLCIARASRRDLEVGLRKTVGADWHQLVIQFLVESLLATLAAAFLALLMVTSLWPAAKAWLRQDLIEALAQSPSAWTLVVSSLLMVSVLAGAYPAFVLASSRPLSMLKRGKRIGGGHLLRRTLIVFQFTVAMTLLVFNFVVLQQIKYIQERDLGFQHSGLMAIEGLRHLGDRWETFKLEVLRLRGVEAASASSSIPGVRPSLEGYLYPGTSTRQEDLVVVWVLETDSDFITTLGIDLLQGDMPTQEHMGDTDSVWINPLLVERLQLSPPVGELVSVGKVPATIRGVFASVHMESLHKPLRETVIRPLLRAPQVLLVRAPPEAFRSIESHIESLWEQLAPQKPLKVSFLDQELRQLYRPERDLMTVIRAFSSVAFALACLGVFGLSALSVAQRRSEIGLRKALGATTAEIAYLLSREFVGLVAVAFALASPLAWWIAGLWLESFSYRNSVDWWIFPTVGLMTLMLALTVIGFQALRATKERPAETLKSES